MLHYVILFHGDVMLLLLLLSLLRAAKCGAGNGRAVYSRRGEQNKHTV